MGLRNNPSRNNTIGSDYRLYENERQSCSISRCANNRSGYSKYCSIHKNHIANTGSLDQEYIRQLKTTLKPYVNNIERVIKDNPESYSQYIDKAKRFLAQPQNLNSIRLLDVFDDMQFHYGSLLSAKTISKLKTLKLDEVSFLAVLVAIHLFQLENPKKLLLGMPLFFHSGKLMYSYTTYKKKISAIGKPYYARANLTKNQYILLGIRLYSEFYPLISEFIKNYKKEVSPSVITPHQSLRVRKTRIEELIEEKEERINFIREQIHANPQITQTMVDKEIIAITKAMDRLIKEETRNQSGS